LVQAIGPLFENQEEFLEVTKQLVFSSQPLFYFDEPAAKEPGKILPSAFETYAALLRNTRVVREADFDGSSNTHLHFTDPHHTITQWLSLFSENQFFAVEEKTDAGYRLIFPAIAGLVEHASGVAKTLYGLSKLNATAPTPWENSERAVFLKTLKQSFGTFSQLGRGRSGTAFHLEFLKQLIAKKPVGLRALFDDALQSGWEMIPSLEDISPDERMWLIRLVQSGDHQPLWNFSTDHLDRKKALDLVVLLRGLAEQRELKPAIFLLSQINNVRVTRIAEVLLDWHDSGELASFLITIEKLLTPLQHVPNEQLPAPQDRYIRIESVGRES
jgi:hypothetical protein